METRTGKQRKTRRFKVLPGGKNVALLAGLARLAVLEEAPRTDVLSQTDADIVCHYGVAVHCTSVEGLELVEFEFLPDAA